MAHKLNWEPLPERAFGIDIERAREIVHDEQRRSAHECASGRGALQLPTGETHAARADDRVEPVAEAANVSIEDGGSKWAWRRWTGGWDAQPGQYSLCCRATDAEGRVQPLEATWNTGGYANNAVHRVAVTVGTLPE